MNTLKVAGLNLDIVWKDKNRNFSLIEEELKGIQADLILLPEMFSTGFCMDAEEIADRNEESVSWMKDFALKKKSAVAGSVSVFENGFFFNRFYFVYPEGRVVYYHKRHLFSYSGEDKIYSPGDERVSLDYKGFKIFLQVCYDLRFPVFSRNIERYDLALYVANWPEPRVDAWKSLLKARSIENQAFVFGVNRIGKDGYHLNYIESSDCYFPDGKIISEKIGNIVYAELHKEELDQFREKFRFLDDADSFEIFLK